MQPHPPQLPTDEPTSPAPKNLKKSTLLLLLVVAVVAALIALILPKKQVEASRQPTAPLQGQNMPRVQRAQTDAYKAPTQ